MCKLLFRLPTVGFVLAADCRSPQRTAQWPVDVGPAKETKPGHRTVCQIPPIVLFTATAAPSEPVLPKAMVGAPSNGCQQWLPAMAAE